MSCEHVNVELRPKTSETISSASKMREDCSSKRWGRSMGTDEQSMFVDEDCVDCVCSQSAVGVSDTHTISLISLQVEPSPHLLTVVTLARPSVPSSLQITNCSFRYASPHLWNQLPSSFRQPHCVHSPPGSPHPAHIRVITFVLTTCHSLKLSLQT